MKTKTAVKTAQKKEKKDERAVMSLTDLRQRYDQACTFTQPLNPEKVSLALRKWIKDCGHKKSISVIEIKSWSEAASAASAAMAAMAAWDASAASAARTARAAMAAMDAMAASAAMAARDASWISALTIGSEEIKNPKEQKLWENILVALENGCWLIWTTENTVYWIPLPEIHTDIQNRPHHDKQCAFKSLDLTEYFWHGTLVDEYVIKNPSEITVKDIETEVNTEVRRVKIERYGQDKYLKDSGAQLIHNDVFGNLWKKEIQDDEPLVMVELLNSTPEPTGEIKTYFLRVPPDMKTAHEAVAWTFNKKQIDYAPIFQS